jgi:hypothetical protein
MAVDGPPGHTAIAIAGLIVLCRLWRVNVANRHGQALSARDVAYKYLDGHAVLKRHALVRARRHPGRYPYVDQLVARVSVGEGSSLMSGGFARFAATVGLDLQNDCSLEAIDLNYGSKCLNLITHQEL